MTKYLISFLVMYVFAWHLIKIIRGIFYPEKTENRRWEAIQKYGMLSYEFRQFPFAIIYVFSLFIAYKYAHYEYLWLAIFVFNLAVFGIGYAILLYGWITSHPAFSRATPVMDAERLSRLVKQRRYFLILDSIILCLWYISWRKLYGV